ncbi:hypothetical protein KFL_000070040 [Klebsormidium nitens]|uniref:Uncharacterized protein n=1 Tax=Klebsormidium nitens TaxID=105231 RepID=A0A1Y1HJF8_KLENI|nr:hypothetical protein KFL_000070040 [Klebsormidium nitens]|eukprot:GAQ78033.1 hypothetical protein KFL_000070040 [Klebsormidium nitens]
MSEFQSRPAADSWDAQGPLSQLDWEQLMQSPKENTSVRKRNRPTSFDVVSLQFPDGGSQFSWPEQSLIGAGGDNLGQLLEGGIDASGQLFGGYGERVESFLAESSDSAAGNPKALTSTSESSGPFTGFGSFGDAANSARQTLDPLPPTSAPAVVPFSRQVSDPLPKPSPAAAQLAPSRSQKVISKSMTTEEIHKAYAQSWGGALKAGPTGGTTIQRQPLQEKPPEKLKREGSKSERSANAAKAQAASIIRDLFRRPGAKRQAVPLEGGQIGVLERGFSQLSAQPVHPPARKSPPFGATPVTSGSSGENAVSPAGSQSTSFPPQEPRPVLNTQAVPPRGLGGAPSGGAGGVGVRRVPRSPPAPAPSSATDLASLQQEAQALLAAMGGSARQTKAPPPEAKLPSKPATSAGKSGSNFQNRGFTDDSHECPLLRAVQVAGCQVALACPVTLDAGLLAYDAWQKISDGCPNPPEELRVLGRQASLNVSGLDDLDSLDWLLTSETGEKGLGDSGGAAGAVPDFGADSSLWGQGFSDLLADVGRSAREPRAAGPSTQSAAPAKSAADPAKPSPTHPLHHLWAQLEPAQVSEPRFQPFRAAYREEVRRLRVWAATFLGEALLPAVAETHFVSCNTVPNLGDRHVRMMLTKGMLWSAFVTHSLVTASPADIYFARHDGPQAYRGTNPAGLDNMTSGMQRKCKNMCFVAEDLKDESTYGPEIFRTYGALHKSVGLTQPPPPPGYACQQITFPDLTDPKPGPVNLNDPPEELIEFDEPQVMTKCSPTGGISPWGMFWLNKNRLLSTGKGLRDAGERARGALQGLFERTIDAHVDKFDVMATGAAPALDRYLSYARFDCGLMVGMGLAFCAFGQSLADAGRWEPTVDDVEQLFEETATAMELAGNVVRITSDLRTYQADLVQLRPNAVAIRMREAHCSHKEALDFLVERAARDIEALGAEIKAHAAKDPFAHACWRLPFELCRVGVAMFTVLGAEGRAKELFELG